MHTWPFELYLFGDCNILIYLSLFRIREAADALDDLGACKEVTPAPIGTFLSKHICEVDQWFGMQVSFVKRTS